MYLVGAIVTSEGFVRLEEEIEILNNTPKQFRIGSNVLHRVLVKKDAIDFLFIDSDNPDRIAVYCFCHDEKASKKLAMCEDLLVTCMERMRTKVGNLIDMYNKRR